MAHENLLRKLSELASAEQRRPIWIDKVSPEFRDFVTEAVRQYLAGQIRVASISHLHRYILQIAKESFTEDAKRWPSRDMFGKWIRANHQELTGQKKVDPKRKK